MKLSPILCFTNSRETAHRLEKTTLVETFFSCTICCQTDIFFVPSLIQTFAPGAALWRNSGCWVFLKTLPWWAEKDAKRIWTRENSTVSRKKTLFQQGNSLEMSKTVNNWQEWNEITGNLLNLILPLWISASWAIMSRELLWPFAL